MSQAPLETRMVDITAKPVTHREALAYAEVQMAPATLAAIQEGQLPKGDVLTIAQLAGIQGAKRCADLIPLCHPLSLTGVELELELEPAHSRVAIRARVKTEGKTGVEMEALSAVSAAALTLYDMCKAMDKEMVIQQICLLEKTGGRSGHYLRKAQPADTPNG